MTAEQRRLLSLATTIQSHYPCQCHDWVWFGDHWDLVPRPKKEN